MRPDPNMSTINGLADMTHEGGTDVVKGLLGMVASKGIHRAGAIYLCGVLANAVLAGMAILTSKQPSKPPKDLESFDAMEAVTSESLLFTALLVNKIAPDREPGSDTFTSQWGPHIVFEALEAYQQLTGKTPDDFLCPEMVKAGRDAGAMGRDMLKAITESHRGGHTLN